jgi:hypothetical protein
VAAPRIGCTPASVSAAGTAKPSKRRSRLA